MSLVRNIDLFLHKRIRHLDEFEASRWGAGISIAAVLLSAYLVTAEMIAFSTPTVTSDVTMDTSLDQHLRVHFNISLPNLPCHFASVDVSDALGVRAVNMSRNINKYTIDFEARRRLGRARSRPSAPTTVQMKHEAGEKTFLLDESNWDDFMRDKDLVLVAFMAPWCPWCKRLMPILELIEGILDEASLPTPSTYLAQHGSRLREHFMAGKDGAWMMDADTAQATRQIRGPPPTGVVAPGLGRAMAVAKVDCTTPLGEGVCRAHHVAAFPTIVLFRPSAGDSFVHYYGPRSPEALLTFVTAYEHVAEEREAHAQALADSEVGDARSVQAALHQARQEALTSRGEDTSWMGLDSTGHWTSSSADAPLWAKLASAMRKAGIPAPGDDVGLQEVFEAPAKNDEAVGGDEVAVKSRTLSRGKTGGPVLGCNLEGFVDVAKVPGRLAITLDHEGHSLNRASANMSHIVHSLSFGEPLPQPLQERLPPEVLKGLHEFDEAQFTSPLPHVYHEHYLKVVGAAFDLVELPQTLHTYKHSVNSHMFVDNTTAPAASFTYDLSPLSVVTTESYPPLYRFVTSLCAIVGGVFTVLGLVDSIVYKGLKTVQRKAALGKLN